MRIVVEKYAWGYRHAAYNLKLKIAILASFLPSALTTTYPQSLYTSKSSQQFLVFLFHSIIVEMQFNIHLVMFASGYLDTWNWADRFGYWLPHIRISSIEQLWCGESWPVDIGIKEIIWNNLFHKWATRWATQMTCLMLFSWSLDKVYSLYVSCFICNIQIT